MFEVSINGKKVKAEVSFYTAWLYENEFGKDLISDFYGVQDFTPIVDVEGGDMVKVDFTKVNWLAATRALWAAMKTASDKTAPYREWMKKTSGVDTWELRRQLDEAITECFFRSEPAEEETQEP